MAANEPLPEAEIGLEQAGLTDSATYDLPKRRRENSLAYEGIPLDSKNLRLIQFQPSDQLHDRISCSLTAVPFGRRPKYQALSYVWGTDTASETIEVNGVTFQIGSNLLGALRFLSTMRDDAAAQDGFWIDAICINQDDIHEKNAQLSIMGQIYFRARSVLVWLKNGSSQTASVVVDQQQRISESQSKISITSKEKAILLEDPYWDRLWILQELGRARRILVCLRLQTVPWKEFVALFVDPVWPHEDPPDRGPLRLDTVIVQAKYATLEQLLCDHIHAKCSNRLDKIYGLLGLAIDGFRFPVDYRKTRFEVWRDTIRFISETIETDLTSMARLVKELLTRDDLVDPQGHQSGCFRQLTPREKDAKLRVETPPPAKQGLTLTAAIMGIIAKVGPPVLDCVGEPVQWSNWRDQVQLSLKSPADKDAAIRANDKLFTSLLDLEDAQILNLCSSRAGPHMWGAGDDALVGDAALQAAQWAERLSLESRLADRPPASGASLSLPRFCLLEAGGAARQPMAPATQLGLVPGVARPGDMLCRVRNSSRALLVRTMPKRDAPGSPGGGGAAMYVRGVATVAEDVGLGPEPPDYDARWRSVQNFPMMRVVLDAETLLQLIE